MDKIWENGKVHEDKRVSLMTLQEVKRLLKHLTCLDDLFLDKEDHYFLNYLYNDQHPENPSNFKPVILKWALQLLNEYKQEEEYWEEEVPYYVLYEEDFKKITQ